MSVHQNNMSQYARLPMCHLYENIKTFSVAAEKYDPEADDQEKVQVLVDVIDMGCAGVEAVLSRTIALYRSGIQINIFIISPWKIML